MRCVTFAQRKVPRQAVRALQPKQALADSSCSIFSAGNYSQPATGLAAAGYGFGAFFTSFPIDNMIRSSGYERTLLVWGIIQAAIGVVFKF